MKSCVALLVLLCCSLNEMKTAGHKLSGQLQTQNEEGENIKCQTKEQRSEAAGTDTSNQQSCQTDITSALLIQMSAALGELRAELRNTKTQMSTLETRLRDSEKQIEQLENKHKDSKVSFSVALQGSFGAQVIGPTGVKFTLIYRDVFTNIGNAYNSKTGIFTAPVKGAYHFTIYNFADSNSKRSVTTSLMKNGQQVLTVHGHHTVPHTVTASNGASLVLEAGDTVYVQLWENSSIFDNVNCHSTFSGHLLFTL